MIFKIGDRVKLKSYKEMENEYYFSSCHFSSWCKSFFRSNGNKTVIIQDITSGLYRIKFIDRPEDAFFVDVGSLKKLGGFLEIPEEMYEL